MSLLPAPSVGLLLGLVLVLVTVGLLLLGSGHVIWAAVVLAITTLLNLRLLAALARRGGRGRPGGTEGR
jgi:hypothetical protein